MFKFGEDSVDDRTRLALVLCETITAILRDPEVTRPAACSDPSNACPVTAREQWPKHDLMSFDEVKFTTRLKGPQITKLRRLWGFPSPVREEGHVAFSRKEVKSWIMQQPNQSNLAAVLRLRRRDALLREI